MSSPRLLAGADNSSNTPDAAPREQGSAPGAWLTPAQDRPGNDPADAGTSGGRGTTEKVQAAGVEAGSLTDGEKKRLEDAAIAALRLVFDQYIRSHASLCAGSDGSGQEGFSRDGALKAPMPSADMAAFNQARPVLTAATILALVQLWAGFLGGVLALYLLSAEVWEEEPEAIWSMVILAVSGALMILLAAGGFYESRRGDACIGASLVGGSIAVQMAGGLAIGILDLPFGYEAAVGVLGLQVLPALMVLIGYGLLRCY